MATTFLVGVKSSGIIGTPLGLPYKMHLVGGYLVGPLANLRQAELGRADLTGMDLSQAVLKGADLRGPCSAAPSCDGRTWSGRTWLERISPTPIWSEPT